MKTILRGILAILMGLVVGGLVNLGLVLLGPHVVPPPPGVDMSDARSMGAAIHLFQPRHFVFPFLAHALGTLAGAYGAFAIAASHRAWFAYAIGLCFLAGGLVAASMIPAPAWFLVLDLGMAYLPMAALATRLGRGLAA